MPEPSPEAIEVISPARQREMPEAQFYRAGNTMQAHCPGYGCHQILKISIGDDAMDPRKPGRIKGWRTSQLMNYRQGFCPACQRPFAFRITYSQL